MKGVTASALLAAVLALKAFSDHRSSLAALKSPCTVSPKQEAYGEAYVERKWAYDCSSLPGMRVSHLEGRSCQAPTR